MTTDLFNYYDHLSIGDTVMTRDFVKATVVELYNPVGNPFPIRFKRVDGRGATVDVYGRWALGGNYKYDIISIVSKEEPFQVQEDYIEL